MNANARAAYDERMTAVADALEVCDALRNIADDQWYDELNTRKQQAGQDDLLLTLLEAMLDGWVVAYDEGLDDGECRVSALLYADRWEQLEAALAEEELLGAAAE
jgi:hypothetical protein